MNFLVTTNSVKVDVYYRDYVVYRLNETLVPFSIKAMCPNFAAIYDPVQTGSHIIKLHGSTLQ